MFGLQHNLNDPSLYLLHDMVEGQIKNAEIELSECAQTDEQKILEIAKQLEYFKSESNKFEKEIEELRASTFQFSIEELYFMYGQYENRFIGIEFHKFSESAKKFGRNVGGVIIYSKSERENLERIIHSEQIPRTNGIVRVDVTSNYDLTSGQHDELINNGFQSRDIYEMLNSNLPFQKSFKQDGIKEIPHTINVNFDPAGMDPYKMALWLFSQRIKDGGGLIETEWYKMCGFSLYYEPKTKDIDYIKSKAFDTNGQKISKVRFYELVAKFFNMDMSGEEAEEFSNLLKHRYDVRLAIIEKEIRKSTNKSLEQFQRFFPELFKSLNDTAINFEDESLAYNGTIVPIFWDFRSYVHIYLRHCEDLQIEGCFINKTRFQYTQKDIKRILKIAIEKLVDRINDRISTGDDLRVFGDKSLYFNGNYYALRIEKDGRVDSFYPLATH
jgi:hypothetical protein